MKKSKLVMPFAALAFALIASFATAALPRTFADNATYNNGNCNDLEEECDSTTGVDCANGSGTALYKINLSCATRQTGNFVP